LASINRESLAHRVPISTVSPELVGAFLALFWLQCVAGIGISAYHQLWLRTDIALTDTILQIIIATGPISLGAAANSLIVVISAEGIMVLAAWVKRRQFEKGLEQGLEKGVEKGRAEERKRANAKMRAWAKDAMEAQQQGRPIPFDQLPINDKSEAESD